MKMLFPSKLRAIELIFPDVPLEGNKLPHIADVSAMQMSTPPPTQKRPSTAAEPEEAWSITSSIAEQFRSKVESMSPQYPQYVNAIQI
jgi:hypothetical protein